MVKHCKTTSALKRFLNKIENEPAVLSWDWQIGLSGYTVVYRVATPGHNVRAGDKTDQAEARESTNLPEEDLTITAEELQPPLGHPMRKGEE